MSKAMQEATAEETNEDLNLKGLKKVIVELLPS